jgi:HEAT repeat protein
MDQPVDRLRAALEAPSSSDRLQAALSAGTHPRAEYVDALIDRCAVEPDFFVRDMLTWALTRHPADLAVPRLTHEAFADDRQARSQALHTLSKIGDPRGWPVAKALLRDPDAEVARSAWRTAAVLVPDGERHELARELGGLLGTGSADARRSLSRALAALGDAAEEVLDAATGAEDGEVRAHAIATARIIRDPDEAFEAALFEARRLVALDASPDGGAGAER